MIWSDWVLNPCPFLFNHLSHSKTNYDEFLAIYSSEGVH